MVQLYIVVPYVQRLREDFGDNQSALVIMDNFKGQITIIFSRLCLLAPC